MNEIQQFPDVIDYLTPFFERCRELAGDNKTLAEIQVAKQLAEVVYAISDDLDCDTDLEEGLKAKLVIRSALVETFKSLDAIAADVGRPIEERRAELLATMTPAQRKLLGFTDEVAQ